MSFDLLRLWLQLECVGFDVHHRLVAASGDTCDDVEAVLGVRYPDSSAVYVRHDIDPMFCTMPIDAIFDEDTVRPLLYTDRQEIEIRREMTYTYTASPPLPTPDVVALGDTADTLDTFVVLHEGAIVARAWSVRRNAIAAEIAVETSGAHRRKGYGRQVVTAWVRYQLESGKTPIYSHRTGNLESKALAKSTGALLFADVVSYY